MVPVCIQKRQHEALEGKGFSKPFEGDGETLLGFGDRGRWQGTLVNLRSGSGLGQERLAQPRGPTPPQLSPRTALFPPWQLPRAGPLPAAPPAAPQVASTPVYFEGLPDGLTSCFRLRSHALGSQDCHCDPMCFSPPRDKSRQASQSRMRALPDLRNVLLGPEHWREGDPRCVLERPGKMGPFLGSDPASATSLP